MQNIEQIRMLVLSAELGSFSACARRLGKVQSAVSHGINSLEIDLDVVLFDRSSRKPKLTPAGERLYRSAKALLAQSAEFELIAQSINRAEEDCLRIGLDDGLLTPAVQQILADFACQFPYTQLDLVTLPSSDIVPALQQGQLSLGLMLTEVASFKEVDFSYIGQVHMIPMCHIDHPLAKKMAIAETDLYPHRQISQRSFKKVEPALMLSMSPSVWWCSSTLAAISLIEQNIGWGYVPKHLAELSMRNGSLVKINTRFDQKTWAVPVDLVWMRGTAIGPGMQWLQNAFKSAFSSK
ncbi:LysR family transcriptional regulator [Maribrevibacterium harenarium]|uniref:LysR family transcriptional regulator n=1 Tax=Maribrevibacterium harenarium TaxID=2589817 RepID=A0A501WCK9_9GAMM|nr:LysR family transcriptional regulator [Maribrevibacterium harenarium]TPE44577.1 LysR family transcriptional regulator [Maribrevibacterium harenarium]